MSNQQLPELTPEQALNALVSAARQAQLSYNDHAMVDHAARTIAKIVLPKQEAVPEPEVTK